MRGGRQKITQFTENVILSGAVATVAFDFFRQSLSPMLGFSQLAPVPLANRMIEFIFGASYTQGAQFLQYFAGLVAYPLGWLLLWAPSVARMAPGLSWLASATLYGVSLWVFALYFVAHIVGGLPAFLGFTGITWIALIGHVLFAVVAVALMRAPDPTATAQQVRKGTIV